jgi:hypothetical protein
MLKTSQVREICDEHETYWNHRRDRLREARNLYLTRYWQHNQPYLDGVLRTEVPKAYQVVESYVGSLYAKDPGVIVGPDLRGRGNPEVAQATANQYLRTIREQIEDATRLALIYPCAFLKLAPVESVDPLKRVSCSALPPWEVIVDATATSWSAQRWVGHVYLMPVSEAAVRYGRRKSSFNGRRYYRWIESFGVGGADNMMGNDDESDVESWVKVVEIYDLGSDKLLVWSPDYKDGDRFLFKGVKVQVGALDQDADADVDSADLDKELVHEETGIPYKSASGRPIVPIIPFYFSREPDVPLRGYSLVERSVDQFRELNVMRTYQAQGVRRMARQWLVKAGFLSEDAAAKISQGLDGEMIEVDLQPGEGLDGNMLPVPNAPIPADIAGYAITVQNDIAEAGLLAPFTRGEVTKSTATEQQLLASYTSNEIGRMARTRDEAISALSMTFNVMLSVILGDEGEPLALPNPVGPTILSADDLTGDFVYYAVDPATTPLNDLAKRAALERLTPLLLQLGVAGEDLLSEVVRTFGLPESFAQPLQRAGSAEEEEGAGSPPLPLSPMFGA